VDKIPSLGVLQATQKQERNSFESTVSQCETKFHIDFAAILTTMAGANEFSPFEIRERE